MTVQNYGARLKKLRTERGMTQLAFAQKLGMDRSSYAHVEQGRQELRGTQLKLAAKELGVSIDYIMTGETEKPIYAEQVLDLLDSLSPKEQEQLVAYFRAVGNVFQQYTHKDDKK